MYSVHVSLAPIALTHSLFLPRAASSLTANTTAAAATEAMTPLPSLSTAVTLSSPSKSAEMSTSSSSSRDMKLAATTGGSSLSQQQQQV